MCVKQGSGEGRLVLTRREAALQSRGPLGTHPPLAPSMETALVRPLSRPWLHLLLLVVTLASAFVSFAFFLGGQGEELGLPGWVGGSLSFALALLSILGAHEMGHYVLARFHGVDTSLPYFIPLPLLSMVGTLGAVIVIRGRIPHRNALVDIGAAGPLAGLVVAVPVLLWGLAHSPIVEAPLPETGLMGEGSLWVLAQRLFGWLMLQLTHASAPPGVESEGLWQVLFGDSLLMQGLRWLAVGPLPAGKQLYEHPVVVAGWFGLLITMLNLMPVGQLDGGHLSFALWGRHARGLGRCVALVLLLLTVFASASWGVWLLVTVKLVGFGHPEVIEPGVPLSRGRKWLCLLCFLALVGCAMPIPLRQVLS
ncbi:Peptidase, M50 (S2P protease) family [Stigmatella aurantiaca DW4/3-1]|uniref:Peptidase, M50 (S2P protease) family n=1 Tax=Stigmatella aurantiaca (strain DW4/3-1) TaxID=378806 RepID=E3FG53_STIAD|nr:Peptidase, M50 (S2P protease) family [Stigmatella aurantiaca DW4/3-1]